MADGLINYGLLDPKLASSFSTGYNEAEDRRNELALRAQQLQHATSQNELSKYTLSSAKRADEQQMGLNALIRDPSFNIDDPASQRQLFAFGPAGVAVAKSIAEQRAAGLTATKTIGDISAQQLKDATDKHNLLAANLAPLAAAVQGGKALTHDDVFGVTQNLISQGLATPADLTRIPQRVEDLGRYVMGVVTGNEKAREGLIKMLPEAMLAGGQIVNKNPLAANGIGARLADVSMTPFQQAQLPIMQQTANARSLQAQTGVGSLAQRAFQFDPYQMYGGPQPTQGGSNALARPAPVAAPAAATAGAAPVAAPAAATAGAAPAAAAGTNLMGTKVVPLHESIRQGLRGEDLLAAMPATVAAQIAAILDHRAAPPTRGTAHSDQMMQLVQLIDPTYDAQQYRTKQGIETAFTAGRPATVLKSLNVVQDHLGVFKDTAAELGNNQTQFINAMGNKIAQWTGKAAPTNFEAVKIILADELAKSILGSAGALGDRKGMQDAINQVNSPEQLKGVVTKWQGLIAGQVKGLADQYESGGGNRPEVLKLLGRAKEATEPAKAASGVDASNKWLK